MCSCGEVESVEKEREYRAQRVVVKRAVIVPKRIVEWRWGMTLGVTKRCFERGKASEERSAGKA